MKDEPENHEAVASRFRAMIHAARRQVADAARDSRLTGSRDGSDRSPTNLDAAALPARVVIPGYRVVREMQRGGQGAVYEAVQESTHRRVAIKVLHEGPFAGEGERMRFEREIRILAQLRHPNIVTIHDSGQAAGHSYYVMEFIDGAALDEYVESAGLDADGIVALFTTICDAIHTAHLLGIVHRDLKPGNIRVRRDGTPFVLDFGLAKHAQWLVSDDSQTAAAMTQSGQFVGSLPWCSPEQARGASDIDARSDVYALGVNLYRVLCGRFPYVVTGSLSTVLSNITNAEPAPLTKAPRRVDDELATIARTCLAKQRERRYADAGALAADLRRYREGEPIAAKRDSVAYVLRKTLRQHWIPVSVAGVIMATATVGFAFSLAFWRQAVAQEANARQAAKTATDRASDLAVVTDFQARILEAIDPQALGVELSHRIRAARGGDDSAEAGRLDALLASISMTDVARDVIAEHLLAPAERQIDREFADRPLIAATLRAKLASAYLSLGQHARAEQLLQAAVATRAEWFGSDDPRTLEARHALAAVRRVEGRFDAAERDARAALEGRRRTFGDESTETAQTRAELGMLLAELGRFDEAEQEQRAALALNRALLGERHPRVSFNLYALARLRWKQHELAEAAALLKEALSICRENRAALDIASCLYDLACVHRESGDFAAVEPAAREAVELLTGVRGATHPDTRAARRLLEESLYELGRPPEDAAVFRAWMQDSTQALFNRGMFDECARRCGDWLDCCRRTLAPDHFELANAAAALGETLLRLNRPADAEPLLGESLEIREKVFPGGTPNASLTHRTRGLLGVALAHQRRFADAEPLVLRSHADLLGDRSGDPSCEARLHEAVERVADMYERWNEEAPSAERAAAALEWRERANSAPKP